MAALFSEMERLSDEMTEMKCIIQMLATRVSRLEADKAALLARNNTASFENFQQLPIEIRLLIWEYACARDPQCIKLRPENSRSSIESKPGHGLMIATNVTEQVDELSNADFNNYGNTKVFTRIILAGLLGTKGQHPQTPSVLLVNKESHTVASTVFAFCLTVSLPNTFRVMEQTGLSRFVPQGPLQHISEVTGDQYVSRGFLFRPSCDMVWLDSWLNDMDVSNILSGAYVGLKTNNIRYFATTLLGFEAVVDMLLLHPDSWAHLQELVAVTFFKPSSGWSTPHYKDKYALEEDLRQLSGWDEKYSTNSNDEEVGSFEASCVLEDTIKTCIKKSRDLGYASDRSSSLAFTLITQDFLDYYSKGRAFTPEGEPVEPFLETTLKTVIDEIEREFEKQKDEAMKVESVLPASDDDSENFASSSSDT